MTPEDQRQRWVKYGSNVIITSAAVVLLAVVAVWASQGTHKYTAKLHGRADLTASGSNQLKPQTISLLQNLPADAKVKLVSLYPKLRKEETGNKGNDSYQRILDILDEYRRAGGSNVSVEAIDPIADSAKADAWLGELMASIRKKYEPSIASYESSLKTAPDTFKSLNTAATAEQTPLKQVISLVGQAFNQNRQRSMLRFVFELNSLNSTIDTLSRQVPATERTISNGLAERIPDYSTLARDTESFLSQWAEAMSQSAAVLEDYGTEEGVPAAVKTYAAEAAPRFRKIEKLAKDAAARAATAGSIVPKEEIFLGPTTSPAATQPTEKPVDQRDDLRRELNELRTNLTPKAGADSLPPAVVVSGKHGIRVIDDESLWRKAQTSGFLSGPGSTKDQQSMRFAGEQQLTSAILGVSQPQRKTVVFVRPGGMPDLTGDRDAPLGELAARLRGYNYEVLERDISRRPGDPPNGMEPPPANEATDEQMKNALWVVVGFRGDPRARQMSAGLSERLESHLAAGGSALVLLPLQGRENFDAALKPFGIDAPGGVLAVHETVETAGGEVPSDMLEQARRMSFIFIANEFGDHPITTPLRSLDAVLPGMGIVRRARISGSDLVIKEEANPQIVRSPTHKFTSAEVGLYLRVRDLSGFNWKAGRYRIVSVDAEGYATLDSSPATGAATPPTGAALWELDKESDLPAGVTVTPIMPLPTEPKSWGETNLESATFARNRTLPRPQFDPATDYAGPLYMGAAAEKSGGSRLVVIAGFELGLTQLLREPDPALAKSKVAAARFPANGELLTNSVFWLSRDEGLMSLSPAAMDVARIAPISPEKLAFIRIWLVLILLPLSAVGAGIWVWTTRRG